MHILIGSPSADGEVEVSFAQSVMALVGGFAHSRPGTTFEIETPIGRSVAHGRDILANRVLQDERFTHLLFIDTDMGFQAELIGRMLDIGKPVVGTIAPQRHRDLDDLREKIAAFPTPLLAEICSATYTPGLAELAFDIQDETDPAALAGMIRANQTGAGILLIRRDALETLRLYCPELIEARVRPEMAAIGLAEPLTRFFAYRRGHEGVLLGEDLSFTTRWVERCGGELWVVPDGLITHTGSRVVTGNYQRKMMLIGEV
jgi:hypothetical protein